MKKTYAEKLRDPRWQRRRLEILQLSDFTCAKCDEATKPLHVHHLCYERGKEPWDYEDHLLVPLCEECHKDVAQIQADIAYCLAQFPPDFLSDLHGALIDILTNRKKHPFEAWGDWIFAARWQKKRKAA